MPLTITWKHREPAAIWADQISPEQLASLSPRNVPHLPIPVGNTPIPLGDLASVDGSAADSNLVLQGYLEHLHGLGRSMTSGHLRILGNVGHYLGSGMQGGSILLEGSAAHWTGSDMLGGLIDVRGNVGDHLGAASPGQSPGMRDGTILVHGSAGDHAAFRMRRGLIAIGKSAGNHLARNLIAGSVFVFGPAGLNPGAFMRRGTILLANGENPGLLPTFSLACRFEPVFLSLYTRHLRGLGFPISSGANLRSFDRFIGDRLRNGQGEILIPHC